MGPFLSCSRFPGNGRPQDQPLLVSPAFLLIRASQGSELGRWSPNLLGDQQALNDTPGSHDALKL